MQSHVTGTLPAVGGYSEDSTYFDGYSCAWFTDKAAFEAAMVSPEWQAVGEDSANVFDDTWFTGMSAHITEVTQIEGASNPYKVVYVVNFRDGMSREDADEHWTTRTVRCSTPSRSTATCRTTWCRRSAARARPTTR